jgi:hypothetical protein
LSQQFALPLIDWVMAAACRMSRYSIAARSPRPDTVLAHDPFDPLAADDLTLGPQFGVDARRSVSFPVLRMDPPDVDQQRTIGDLPWAVRP